MRSILLGVDFCLDFNLFFFFSYSLVGCFSFIYLFLKPHKYYTNKSLFIDLAYESKIFVFIFIIEYSSLRFFGL